MIASGRLMLTLSLVTTLALAGGHPSVDGRTAPLWVQRYHGPGKGNDGASSLLVSPAGRRVFVTGTSHTAAGGDQYSTIAYNASSGRQVWISNYNTRSRGISTNGIAISPDGHQVFVAGYPAVVAYNADTGTQLWTRLVDG